MIYTDSSLSGSKVASAAVLGDEAFTLRLPDKSSIFTAEMYALLIAFQQIERSPQKHSFGLCNAVSVVTFLFSMLNSAP